MKSILLISALIAGPELFAKPKTPQRLPQQLNAVLIDQNIDPNTFPKDTKFHPKKSHFGFSREQRETEFGRLKLTPYFDKISMDELDRDVLYIYLKNKPLEKVIQKFPELPPEVLKYAKDNFKY